MVIKMREQLKPYKDKLDNIKQAHVDLEERKIVGPAVIIP